MISKAYKYRLYPTEEQKVLLSKTFGCVRVVWNKNVETFNSWNRKTNPKPEYATSTQIRAQYDWMQEVSAAALQQKEIDFKEFRKQYFSKNRKAKQARCRFKNKYSKQSFRLPNQKFTLKQHKIRLEKIGWVPAKIDRHPPKGCKYLSVTVSRDACGAYYASVLVQYEEEATQPSTRAVGVDMGLKDFVVTSDGERVEAPSYFRKSQAELAKMQRNMSRKKKGSNRYRKNKLRVARIHRKIARQRAWFLHQISHDLVRDYGLISIEDLNVPGMKRNSRLAKSISDAGWGEFVRMMEYKASWHGTLVQKVDRFFPSSKTCSDCGWMKSDLTLSDREWVCEGCGVVHDRDLNASINILQEAFRILDIEEKAQGVACAVRAQSDCQTSGLASEAGCVEASKKIVLLEEVA